jgi:hypothetical protein
MILWLSAIRQGSPRAKNNLVPVSRHTQIIIVVGAGERQHLRFRPLVIDSFHTG